MYRVRLFDIPQEIRDIAYSTEEVWRWGRDAGGWMTWKGTTPVGAEYFLQRNVLLDNYPHLLPDFIKKMEQYQDDGETMISAFVSDCPETDGALGWHVDGYHVYAFNVEGNTVWEYFDLDSGSVKSCELNDMDKMIFMPCGVTHRVRILSEGRTSISLVRPGDIDGQRVQYKRT